MQRACRLPALGSAHQLQTDVVIGMAAPKGGDEDGGIEELLHLNSRRRLSRSRSSKSGMDWRVGSPWYTHTPRSFLSSALGRTGRSVICSPRLSNSSVSPGLRWSSLRSVFG